MEEKSIGNEGAKYCSRKGNQGSKTKDEENKINYKLNYLNNRNKQSFSP